MRHALPDALRAAAAERDIPEAELMRQWSRLKGNPSYCTPHSPCQRGSGIQSIPESELRRLAAIGIRLNAAEAVRMVPASGAASRMFKALASRHPEAMAQLDARWSAFPFRQIAEESGPCGDAESRWEAVMERLDLPSMPKGGLPFHVYPNGVRTAFEEHMHEWRATVPEAEAPHVHFTLPALGRAHWHGAIERWATLLGVTVSSSVQHPATDTMAVDAAGQPFMLEDGTPLFRPGGHGALLRNLSDIAHAHPGALVSIKNIDNVRPESAHDEVLPWRRALLGLARELDVERHAALAALAEGDTAPAIRWLDRGFRHPEEQITREPDGLRRALDRPLLVAGMVRNEGEPGGGPFWLRDDEGTLRAQIVESAEMDVTDERIGNCMAGATHFNPVDLVCVLHDAQGRPHDLGLYVDPRRDFLVSKSHGGKPLTGLEHPGLWNGAMGRWNTLFVEVPSRTFAPVKTVFDLLRPAHRL